jgi:type II secretory ATPase GspE/PulE/Tfp pilus assembly ATPase PilB-like protein
VRRLTKSKEQYFLSPTEIKNLSKLIDLDRMLAFLKEEKLVDAKATWEKIPFYKPVKSADSEDGYQSRVGIHEVLKVSSAIKELISSGAGTDQIEAQAKKEGMMTMIEDGIFQCVLGNTTIEEVFRVVSE